MVTVQFKGTWQMVKMRLAKIEPKFKTLTSQLYFLRQTVKYTKMRLCRLSWKILRHGWLKVSQTQYFLRMFCHPNTSCPMHFTFETWLAQSFPDTIFSTYVLPSQHKLSNAFYICIVQCKFNVFTISLFSLTLSRAGCRGKSFDRWKNWTWDSRNWQS